jgi:transcriptional regulator with XRE-family HTH domain
MASKRETEFGRRLRRWRLERGLSQLELAERAGTTSRHLSFLETGRSRPRTPIVLRLGRELALPLREQNGLLDAAGLPPQFPERPPDDAAMAPFKAAIASLLASHDPLPAAVLDRYGAILHANTAFEKLSPGLMGASPEALVDVLFGPGPWRDSVENWSEVASAWFARQRMELHRTGDSRLAQLISRAERLTGSMPDAGVRTDAPVVCTRLRISAEIIELFTAVVRFDNATDVALSELRIELIYPANDAAARFLGVEKSYA